METKKQELTSKPYEYANGNDLMECFFSNPIDKFCIVFNAKLMTFKTWNGFVNKRNDLIEKYKLELCNSAE